VTTIPVSVDVNAPALVTVGRAVSPIATTVESGGAIPFQVINLVGSSVAGVGTYNGYFVVNLDQTKLIPGD